MKNNLIQCNILRALIVGSLAFTAILGVSSKAFGDENSPDQQRARDESRPGKNQDLNSQGASNQTLSLVQGLEEPPRSGNNPGNDRGPQRREGNNPNPENRERSQQLRQRLEEAVASGNMEGASKLKQEIAELETSQAPRRLQQQLANEKERLSKISQQIGSLRERGQHEEAQRLEERARGLREKLMAGGQPFPSPSPQGQPPMQPRFPESGPGPGPQFNGPQFNGRMQEPPRGQPFPSPGPQGQPPMQPQQQRQPQGDMGNRLNHIQVAIENLHAAGMHDAANRLAQETERLQRQNRDQQQPRRPGPNRRNGDGDVQSLRGEIKELRQAVQELRHQLDEIRQRR